MDINKKSTFTVRVAEHKKKELDQIAKSVERDRSYIVNEAIDTYLSHQEWQHKHILKGVAEADAGEFASSAEVKKAFQSNK